MANKRYDQFTAGVYTGTDILLQADPVTGALEKIPLSEIAAAATGAYTPLAAFITDATNAGAGETDLYSYNIPANTFTADGAKVLVEYFGQYVAPTLAQIRVYVASSNFALAQSAANQDWIIRITLIRIDSDSLRICIEQTAGFSGVMDVQSNQVNSLDFTADINIKITGQDASGSTIVAKAGFIDSTTAP